MTESDPNGFRSKHAFGPKEVVPPLHQSGVIVECSHTFKELLEAESDAQVKID